MSDYEELISALVKKFATVVKKETIIAAANSIDGLKVSETGDVTALTKPGGVVFEELYAKYKAMGGGVARIFAKQAVKPILEVNPGLKVPDELR